MKKLIVLSLAGLIVAVSAIAGEPALLGVILFMPMAMPSSLSLGVTSGADVSAITSFAAVNQLPLISTLVNGLDIAKDIMVYPNVKNKVPMPKLLVGSGFRPYGINDDWKTSDLTYTDRFLEVRIGKRDLMIDIEAYRKTYLMWAQSPGAGATQKDIPFAQYMWLQIIKKIQAEINDSTTYKGFDNTTATLFNAGTVYTFSSSVPQYVTFATATNNPNGVLEYYKLLATTTAGQSPDTTPSKWQLASAAAVAPGIESYLLTEITAATISPVATGAVTDGTTAVSSLTQVFRSFTVPYKNWGVVEHVSFTDWEFLLDGLLNNTWKYTTGDTAEKIAAQGYLILPNTNGKCFVKPASWLGTSRRVIAGPIAGPGDIRNANIFLGTDVLNDMNTINVLTQAKLHQILASIQCALGFQIQDVSAIRVNDQA